MTPNIDQLTILDIRQKHAQGWLLSELAAYFGLTVEQVIAILMAAK